MTPTWDGSHVSALSGRSLSRTSRSSVTTLLPRRRDDRAGPRPLDAFDVAPGDYCHREAAGGVAPHRLERLAHPRRAHDVDAQSARQLERRGACERLDAGVDEARGRAAGRGLLREDAAGEREGAA